MHKYVCIYIYIHILHTCFFFFGPAPNNTPVELPTGQHRARHAWALRSFAEEAREAGALGALEPVGEMLHICQLSNIWSIHGSPWLRISDQAAGSPPTKHPKTCRFQITSLNRKAGRKNLMSMYMILIWISDSLIFTKYDRKSSAFLGLAPLRLSGGNCLWPLPVATRAKG